MYFRLCGLSLLRLDVDTLNVVLCIIMFVIILHRVSAAEQTLIINTHNNYRAGTWDDEVASIAQKWADNCVTSHDQNYNRFIPGRLQSGQNLYYGSAKVTWDQPINAWHSEVSDFTFGGSNNLGQVGHYTQVVWAKSTKIGCGYAKCGSVYYYVCNYSPP
ncbi:hypothetical protein KUTeg_023107 [Tegillarca granosa]|uniref:SCP domain-containing protein n=1 Tax=Tegillarca granosa TaxID=220873 RepID=A0ABQ9E1A8_TEGGR|nr:hypothetical protein KUTeg_023107 [Tegillarca granosa]